mgnify:CR=1 FL=1
MYMNDGIKTKINLRSKSVFITGVAGFIGSNLAKRLLSTVEDVKVVGLDNMNHYYDVRLKEARLNELEQFENFSFVKGNLADKSVIEAIFEQYKPEIVVNLGAQAGVRYSITNPDAYVEANLIGFYNILEACRHSYDEGHTPVEHLVYASSSSVYGSNKKVPYSTDDKVDNPVSLYALLLPICTIVINIYRSIVVDRQYPDIKCEGSLSHKDLYDLGKCVVGLTINKISQVFRNSFDSIIISSFIGLVCLAQYQNYYYIVSALTIIMNVIMTAVGAGIGNGIASESKQKNYMNYKELLFEYGSIASIFVACMFCLMQDFITFWVGKENQLQFSSVILCSIYFFSMRLGDVTAIYRQSAGLWWEDRLRPVIEAIVNLTLNILLVKHLGVNGVILSTIISIIVINIPWATYVLFKYYFKISAGEVFAKMMGYSLKAILCCAVAFAVCKNIHISSLLGTIFLKGMIAWMASIGVLFICNFKNPEAHKFINRIKLLNLTGRGITHWTSW